MSDRSGVKKHTWRAPNMQPGFLRLTVYFFHRYRSVAPRSTRRLRKIKNGTILGKHDAWMAKKSFFPKYPTTIKRRFLSQGVYSHSPVEGIILHDIRIPPWWSYFGRPIPMEFSVFCSLYSYTVPIVMTTDGSLLAPPNTPHVLTTVSLQGNMWIFRKSRWIISVLELCL